MNNLNRRDFMKMMGIAVTAPAALLKASQKRLTHPVDIFQEITGVPDSPALQQLRDYCDEPAELIWHTIYVNTLKEGMVCVQLSEENGLWNPAYAALWFLVKIIKPIAKIDLDSFLQWAEKCDIYSLEYRFPEKQQTAFKTMVDIAERGKGWVWFTSDGIKGLYFNDPELIKIRAQCNLVTVTK